MVSKPNGDLRTLSLLERERLMGFPDGYISYSLNPKLSIQQSFDVGACMIGNSFNVHAIALLMDSLVACATERTTPRQLGSVLDRGPPAPKAWCSSPAFSGYVPPDDKSGLLIEEFMRQADRGGSDVKLDVGVPYRSKAWPRSGLRSHLFTWKVVHGYPWHRSAHIIFWSCKA